MRKGLTFSNRPWSLARTRSATGTTLISVAFLFAAGIVSITPGLAQSADATSTGIPMCSNPDVTEVISTSQESYGPGIMVVINASIRNTSEQVCSVAVGPTSPSLTVTTQRAARCGTTASSTTNPARVPFPWSRNRLTLGPVTQRPSHGINDQDRHRLGSRRADIN